jgi:hypothetical protein
MRCLANQDACLLLERRGLWNLVTTSSIQDVQVRSLPEQPQPRLEATITSSSGEVVQGNLASYARRHDFAHEGDWMIRGYETVLGQRKPFEADVKRGTVRRVHFERSGASVTLDDGTVVSLERQTTAFVPTEFYYQAHILSGYHRGGTGDHSKLQVFVRGDSVRVPISSLKSIAILKDAALDRSSGQPSEADARVTTESGDEAEGKLGVRYLSGITPNGRVLDVGLVDSTGRRLVTRIEFVTVRAD